MHFYRLPITSSTSATATQLSSTLAHARSNGNSWLSFAAYPSESLSLFRTVYFQSNITLGFLSFITCHCPFFVVSWPRDSPFTYWAEEANLNPLFPKQFRSLFPDHRSIRMCYVGLGFSICKSNIVAIG